MVDFIKNIDLKGYNTFGIRARADYYAEFAGIGELRHIMEFCREKRLPWYLIGGGSNILLLGDYRGVIIHPVSQDIEVLGESGGIVEVRCAAGVRWDDFVCFCVKRGYGGLENLSAIPGLVGAAPIQNIGAYGAEAGECIKCVEAYLPESDNVLILNREECRFGYRDSVFKRELKGKAIILSVTFALSTQPEFNLEYGDVKREVEVLGGATLANISRAVKNIRDSKLPDPAVLGNSGSFFKNPVVDETVALKFRAEHPDAPLYPAEGGGVKLAAGWLIDRCGWKGYREGDAGVHSKQALVLVNYGGATGEEIMAVARKVIADVKGKFGVDIEPEVNIL